MEIKLTSELHVGQKKMLTIKQKLNVIQLNICAKEVVTYQIYLRELKGK